MYQIHWKGYLSVHDTWEPEDNVHAPELLQKWKKDKGRWPTVIRRAHIPTKRQAIYQAHQITPPQQDLTPPNLPRRQFTPVSAPYQYLPLLKNADQRALAAVTTHLEQIVARGTLALSHHEIPMPHLTLQALLRVLR